MRLSDKQLAVLEHDIYSSNYTSLCGESGSGKSWIANLKFYEWFCQQPAGSKFLLGGNTSKSLFKNVISDVMRIDSDDHWLRWNGDILTSKAGAYAFAVGVNNEGAQARIRGGSLDGVYFDEITTCSKENWEMIDTRLRAEDEKTGLIKTQPALITLNPDDDDHWYNQMYLSNAQQRKMKCWDFDHRDNPIMTEEFWKDFSMKFSGDLYEQMILGKWTRRSATVIVPEFDKTKHCVEFEIPKYYYPVGGMDHGYVDNTGYLIGYYNFHTGTIDIIREYRTAGVTTNVCAKEIRALNESIGKKVKIYSDTNLQFIADLSQIYGLDVVPTAKDHKDAQIQLIRSFFQQNVFRIDAEHCPQLCRQLKTGRWDKKRLSWERTEENGHCDLIDALIYLVRNIERKSPLPMIPDGVKPSTHHIPEEWKNAPKNETNRVVRKIMALKEFSD